MAKLKGSEKANALKHWQNLVKLKCKNWQVLVKETFLEIETQLAKELAANTKIKYREIGRYW